MDFCNDDVLKNIALALKSLGDCFKDQQTIIELHQKAMQDVIVIQKALEQEVVSLRQALNKHLEFQNMTLDGFKRK